LEELNKDKFIEFNFFEIYLKAQLGLSDKKYFELLYIKKSIRIQIQNIEKSLLSMSNLIGILKHMQNTENTDICKPKIKTFSGIRNHLYNNKAIPRKYLTLKNYFPTKNHTKIKKDYEFSKIKDTLCNHVNPFHGKTLIVDNLLNPNKKSKSPIKDTLINYGNYSKVLISGINEYVNQNNESYYENRMNNFSKAAHEFKTPLNAIIGLITEIKDNPTITPKVLCNIDIINNLSNYLIFLISDITQFINQNTKSSIVIITETVFLKSIIEFCFEILNSLLICKNSYSYIKTEIIYDKRLNAFEIISNDMRIKQILLNFISNSVKFTKSGFIKIKTELKSKNGNKYIKVSIIDSGVGIREEDQKKIFNEIYTDMKTESNNHGSGLGLNICKSIAEKLNHNLKFKSKYGEGSKFSLLISECCLKKDENNQNCLNLNKHELNDFNKINHDKDKIIPFNSINKKTLCNLNKKEELFLNVKTETKERRKSFDTNIIPKKLMTFKDLITEVEKTKTFRGNFKNDIYNILINPEDKNEEITLRYENPLIFKYSNQLNKNSSDEISSKTVNLNNMTINSCYNLYDYFEIENFSSSFDNQNYYPYVGQSARPNGISSFGNGDYKDNLYKSNKRKKF